MTALQSINLGTAPAGSDGDTTRAASVKANSNVAVLNAQATLTSAPVTITAASALTAALHLGKRVNIALAAAGIVNVPAASTCGADGVLHLRNVGTTVVTLAITTGSGDTLAISKLNPGESVLLDTDGVHAWTVLLRGRTNSDNETVNGALTAGSLTVNGLATVSGLTMPNGIITFADGSKLSGSQQARNYLDNACGLINTRGYVSGTATTAANQYTLDRWRVVTAGQSLQFTTGTVYSIVMTAPAGGVEQVMDAFSTDGGTFTLSWTGTATATINGVGVVNGGSAVLPASGFTSIKFFSGTFSNPQLVKGTVVLPFTPTHPAVDRTVCAWYCRSLRYDEHGYATAGLYMVRNLSYGAPMRSAPTVTVIGTPTYAGIASPPSVTATAGFLLMYLNQGTTAGAWGVDNYNMLLSADM
ncbi:hypothetical protein SAMN05443245_3442 [Paraburkholderia fungorum]|uniref:Uncharacterized protein n=1 Tax=Paraburkholderia fungorum TaxID=134537 RepID=A0A1H1H175_9BURK|nr:hypothetical protein [Paraburkholderia fungorum]SDR19197.1 hypothetical protein SAMN05443245_3442 [Paraburkholderia fungorum]